MQEKFIDTESSFADAVFLLRKIGPAINGYEQSPALVRQIQYLNVVSTREYAHFTPSGPHPVSFPSFLIRSIFRLTCQIAMTTGDVECIAVLCEALINQYPPEIAGSRAVQLSAEYGVDVVSAIKILQTDLHPHRLPAILRWKHEFLSSKYGSSYQSLAEVSEAPSFELTRKVIQDLRQWKQSG